MATDFFEKQDAARRNTSRLVILFGLAVLAILGMLYALAVLLTSAQSPDAYSRDAQLTIQWWQPELLVLVALATLVVVAGGSLYKISQLRGGGSVVAEALGGKLVPPNTQDPHERVLLNVVEEMAIASGTPTPTVYMMNDEPGINAFAAGFTPGDAVVGVTRGCVEQLSRDELQGVVAHEFSHILNGDMRLNIRLIGVLHGILIIGITGYFLLRSSMFSSYGRRHSSRDSSGMAMLAAGLGLMVAGFLGSFFGNLIKASVSRQREFLADASAVQFTRNPSGIAGALKRIGGFDEGSIIENPNAPESSHLFFSQGLRGGVQMLFATHPPLAERIRRLDPTWEGTQETGGSAPVAAAEAAASGFAGAMSARSPLRSGLPAAPEGSALDQIGRPTAAHIEYASALVNSLPPEVTAAAHEPYGARAVVYALLINRDPSARQLQLEQLTHCAEPCVERETLRLLPAIETLDANVRLPLIDVALPALHALSPSQYQTFLSNVHVLVEADQQIDLFEWTLQRILLTHLRPHFERVPPPRVRHRAISRLAPQCAVVLSLLAYAGGRSETAVRHAFEQGCSRLRHLNLALLPPTQCGLAHLDRALAQMDEATPSIKQRLLGACAVCISADRQVTVAESELLRAIADALSCPMPPLLPGQPLV
jgi:Zn-dependent protease with chaperone function